MRRKSAKEDFFRLVKTDPRSYFFFMDRTPLIYTIMMGSSLFKNVFFKPANYYQTFSVTYLRKNLDKPRKSSLIKK